MRDDQVSSGSYGVNNSASCPALCIPEYESQVGWRLRKEINVRPWVKAGLLSSMNVIGYPEHRGVSSFWSLEDKIVSHSILDDTSVGSNLPAEYNGLLSTILEWQVRSAPSTDGALT